MTRNRSEAARTERSGGISSADMPEQDFERFRRLIHETAGISLGEGKKDLLRARLGKIMRSRGIRSYRDYFRLILHDGTGGEIARLLDAVSTNLTFFFREADHFHFLRDTVIPEIRKTRAEKGGGRIRGWSAGCSTGEEPYSIAICLTEMLGEGESWDARLLATDLSTRVVSIARIGLYGKERLRGLSREQVARHFRREDGGSGKEMYRIAPAVQRMVTFGRLNLLDSYPFRGPFDFLFCRNVMIYFDRKTQETLIGRFHDYLVPGGYLFIGHSESLTGVSHPFRYVRPSVYRKARE